MVKKFKQAQNKVAELARRAGFYARRLRAEKITKRVVMSVTAFALVLQLTAGAFPFANTTVGAVGDDNIIRGGITSKEDLLAMYDRNSDSGGHNDIQQIYSHFGVSRQDIANSTMGTYKTNDFNGQLKTIGRTNWPNSGRTEVTVEGTSTSIYAGPFLDNANTKAFVMPALIGKRAADGQWFAVTLNCGNIVYSATPAPLPKPVAAQCTSLSATRTGRSNFKFATKHTAGSDTAQDITYVISDASGKEIARSTSSTYTQTEAGTYTVKAIVNVTDAEGKQKTISSDACRTQITVPPAATGSSTSPKRCTIPGKEDLSATDPSCKEEVMCTVVGREDLPADDPACVEPAPAVTTPKCTIAGKTDLDANSPDCVVDRTAPPAALPETGLGEDILRVTGFGSLIAAIGYYVASRRGLLSALTD
ncbi:MAG: hypothetical protein JWO55_374 [Candidatus Saccharibacteria bacterium]|jgi:hypothetical protein|nr:hypothetical protein [Candidatus Saccharibacteria bacterium]